MFQKETKLEGNARVKELIFYAVATCALSLSIAACDKETIESGTSAATDTSGAVTLPNRHLASDALKENGMSTVSPAANLAANSPSASNSVSLVSLIANPDKFSGKSILVSGFLSIEPKDNRLYLSESDANYDLVANAINLAFASGQPQLPASVNRLIDCDRQHAALTGTFDAKTNTLNVTNIALLRRMHGVLLRR